MRQKINKCQVLSFAIPVRIEIIMCILAPVVVDACHTIIVLCAKSHSLSNMSFEQCHINQIVGFNCTGRQSCCQLAIINSIWNRIINIGRFDPSVATHIINKYNIRKNRMAFIKNIISYESAGIKNCDILLRYTGITDQAFQKRKNKLWRCIQLR